MALKERSIETKTRDKHIAPLLYPAFRGPKKLDAKSLKGILSYLSYLYSEGEISDKAFETLVKFAYSAYVESAVEEKVEKVLGRYFAKL